MTFIAPEALISLDEEEEKDLRKANKALRKEVIGWKGSYERIDRNWKTENTNLRRDFKAARAQFITVAETTAEIHSRHIIYNLTDKVSVLTRLSRSQCVTTWEAWTILVNGLPSCLACKPTSIIQFLQPQVRHQTK